MKALRYPCMLLMAYAFICFYSCKKIPPQYVCNTPVKTVTVYDTASSTLSFERRYTYDQQGRVDSIIDIENNSHGTGPLTYIMTYDVQNHLTNVRLIGLVGTYDIQYRSVNGLISGISSPLFVATNYAYTFSRNVQWYTGATAGLLISNGSSKLKEIAYFTNTLHPTDADSVITSARSSNTPEESKYYYTYSNELNPEYTAYNNGWFYAYSINQHYALQYDPAASSLHLPSSSHHLLLHQSPTAVTSYNFTKDRCGRVTKVYAIQQGVQKLWKIYTYY